MSDTKKGVGYASVTDLEKQYVMEALDSQRLSQGKFVAKFEQGFALAHGNQYGIMCNSGTTALELALLTLKELEGWGSDTEILCPAITFIATSNAVLHTGMKVRFVDVDPFTYNMNPEEIEKHITQNTKCIIPVHTFGMPCDMNRIMEIATRYQLRVIEDCAEAHFAKVEGQVIGSFGDMSCFSTYVAHTITTGVGGVVCTSQREHMEILRSLVAHGRACTCERCVASDGGRVCPKRMETEIDRRFLFVRLGHSYRVGEIEGALGLAQLERKDEIMSKRQKNAALLIKELQEYETLLQLPRHPANVEHTYMMFPILVKRDSQIPVKELVSYLEARNVETRPMLPLLNQPIYKRIFGDIASKYPVANDINDHGFYIGCHHGLEEAEMLEMANIIKEYCKQYIKEEKHIRGQENE